MSSERRWRIGGCVLGAGCRLNLSRGTEVPTMVTRTPAGLINFTRGDYTDKC